MNSDVFGMTDEINEYEISQIKLKHERNKQRDKKPILVLDFDGVLHCYSSGWRGADVIPDYPVEGAQDFCFRMMGQFDVWIVSSRCNQPGGSAAIKKWLSEWNFPEGIHISEDGSKPAAFVTLDDRAVTFNGIWPEINDLLKFKPWYAR